MLPVAQTPATAWRPALAAWCRRLVLCVVASCVGVQGVALSADRVLGSRHVHVADVQAPAHPVGDLDGHRYAPEIADASDRTARDGTVPHHQEVQQHDHDVDLPGVIRVADDGGTSSQKSPASLVRSVHDLDPLIPTLDLPPTGQAASTRSTPPPRGHDSHVSPPLERPPQV